MNARGDEHLHEDDVAAFVDGRLPGDRRALVQHHLATCAECRAEASEVARIASGLRERRRPPWRIVIPAVAAATLLAVWAAPLARRDRAVVTHRDEVVAATAAPRPLGPTGAVDQPIDLRWTPVTGATRYRVRLFADDGALLWERETTATSLALPDSVAPRGRAASYHWKVEAEMGFERWIASELTDFTVRDAARP